MEKKFFEQLINENIYDTSFDDRNKTAITKTKQYETKMQ